MPTTSTARRTTPPTRESLEQQQAEAAAALADIYEAEQRERDEQQQRQAEAQRSFDEEVVASYSAEAAEKQVRDARAALYQALEGNPLVLAFADYLTALRRASHTQFEVSAALSRLGRPTFRPAAQVTDLVGGVDEYVIRAVEQVVSARIDADRADLHARRDAAGLD